MTETRLSGAPVDDLVEYEPPVIGRRLLKRWWVLAVAAAIGAAGGAGVALHSTTHYTATARIQVSSDAASVVAGSNVLPAEDPARAVATEAAIVGSDAVRTSAQQALGYEPPVADVSSGADDVISVSVTDPDAAGAGRDANAYVTAYFAVVAAQTREQLMPQITQLQQSIASITQNIDTNAARVVSEAQIRVSANAPQTVVAAAQASSAAAISALTQTQSALISQRSDLQTQLNRISGLLGIGSLHSHRLSDATVPMTPSNSSRARVTGIGSVVGLAIGALLAVALGPIRRRGSDERLSGLGRTEAAAPEPAR